MELYRRHTQKCPHRKKGIAWSRCGCPIWADGPHPVTGERVRRSLETRDWSRAQRLLVRWETEQLTNPSAVPNGGPTVSEAIEAYMKDCRARNLQPSTLRSYQKTFEHFAAACPANHASEIRIQHITDFRNARAESEGRKGERPSPKTLRKELENVRVFCEFLVTNEWLASNPARKVKAPKDNTLPTMPFNADEVKALLKACDEIDNNNEHGIERARLRARALVLLLLYSGLRISDAIRLERSRIDASGRLMIRMMKTSEAMYVRLPKSVTDALARLPVESKYFFWSGKSVLATAVGSARRTVDCIGRLAGVNAHPHRFRDTFSVELLKGGSSLETVQWLLGHTSIKTTERHYRPWVTAFQSRLDEATSRLNFVSSSGD